MNKIRPVLIGTAVMAALLATSSVGFAQGTSRQRSACMGDAFRFCSSAIPNVSRVTACMKSNYARLTPLAQTLATDYARLTAGCKATFPKG